MVYGFLHCHSHHSQMDSTTKIDELCKTVKEMGAKAISLTDHGVCTGHIEFMDACKKYGLNGIPGVEAYLDTEYAENAHLLLLPQNYTGYQELCHAVTESNKNQRSIGGINTPVMTKEILANSFVSGNVIATSACISGVLSAILLKNQKIHHEIEKLERKQERCINPNDPEYLQLIIQRDTLFSDVSAMKEKKKELQVLAGKKYKQRRKA
ncbi:MAG: PHP domain-containing protein [Lachnospiraceae bacterium]